MYARKRYGQHFLHDPSVIERIIASVAPRSDEALLEIGPGHGALTEMLLAAAGTLDVVEIDRDLVRELQARYAGQPRLRVHSADALDFDYAALAREHGRPLRVVGNLPYNVSTPLLFRLLAAATHVRDMHFMLQREVVDRIVAVPGNRQYGRLGVMLAPRVRATRLFEVGPGAFRPAPKVWSAVIRMRFRPPAVAMTMESRALFERLIRSLFAQRRKTVANALRPLATSLHADARLALARAGIDPSSRPETLHLADLAALAAALGSPAGSSVV